MAREAIQALDKILQFNYQKDRAKVQESLAFMQFAEQKRQNDIKVFSSQLETLGKANEQMKIKVKKDFISNSGLEEAWNMIPMEHKEGDDIDLSSAVSYLKNKKKGGFSKENATTIANAMWSSKVAKDHDMLINLANTANEATKNISFNLKPANINNKKNVSDQQKSLVNSLLLLQSKTGKQGLGTTMEQAGNIKTNEANILKEQFQFAKGDTQIQSDFGMFGMEAAKQFEESQKVEGQKEYSDQDVSGIADGFEALTPGGIDLNEEEEFESRTTLGALATAGALGGGAGLINYLNTKHIDQLTEGEKDLLKDYKENRKAAKPGRKAKGPGKEWKNPFALNEKEFKEKYGFDKKGSGKTVRSQKVKKGIRQQSFRKHTSLGRATEKVTTSLDDLKNTMKKGKLRKSFIGKGLYGSRLSPLPWGSLARAMGGMVNEETGLVGQALAGTATAASGLGGIVLRNMGRNKLKKTTFLKFLYKRAPSVGLRMLAISQADSPALPFADLAALGWGLSEVWQAHREWKNLDK